MALVNSIFTFFVFLFFAISITNAQYLPRSALNQQFGGLPLTASSGLNHFAGHPAAGIPGNPLLNTAPIQFPNQASILPQMSGGLMALQPQIDRLSPYTTTAAQLSAASPISSQPLFGGGLGGGIGSLFGGGGTQQSYLGTNNYPINRQFIDEIPRGGGIGATYAGIAGESFTEFGQLPNNRKFYGDYPTTKHQHHHHTTKIGSTPVGYHFGRYVDDLNNDYRNYLDDQQQFRRGIEKEKQYYNYFRGGESISGGIGGNTNNNIKPYTVEYYRGFDDGPKGLNRAFRAFIAPGY